MHHVFTTNQWQWTVWWGRGVRPEGNWRDYMSVIHNFYSESESEFSDEDRPCRSWGIIVLFREKFRWNDWNGYKTPMMMYTQKFQELHLFWKGLWKVITKETSKEKKTLSRERFLRVPSLFLSSYFFLLDEFSKPWSHQKQSSEHRKQKKTNFRKSKNFRRKN